MITNLISQLSALSPLNKFDQLISAYEYFKLRSNRGLKEPTENISLVLSKIEELRFELGHNKATESSTVHLDRTLSIVALNLATMIYKGKELKKYVDGALYYEKNEELVEIYKQMTN